MRNEANKTQISSSNPWIRHFKKGNVHEAPKSCSPEEKPSLTQNLQQFPASDLQLCCQQTSCSNTGASMLLKLSMHTIRVDNFNPFIRNVLI